MQRRVGRPASPDGRGAGPQAAAEREPRLPEQLRQALPSRHYSPRTEPTYEDWVREAFLAPRVDKASGLYCQVDGTKLEILGEYRMQSPAFFVDLPEDNVFGIPAGEYGPAAADGYYIRLAPLSAGKHTIKFGATKPNGAKFDIVYHLTVVGGKK